MRIAARGAGYAALAIVAFLLWPQTLGGRVAYVMVSGHSMEPTMHQGDVTVVVRQSSYRRGDVIAYKVPRGQVGTGVEVMHRIVGGTARHGYITRGDNNDYDDPWRPRPGNIVGVRRALLPNAGGVFANLHGPLPLAAFAGLLTVIATASFLRRRPAREGTAAHPSPAGPTQIGGADDSGAHEARVQVLCPPKPGAV